VSFSFFLEKTHIEKNIDFITANKAKGNCIVEPASLVFACALCENARGEFSVSLPFR
jgi:hypothetical protein